MYHKKRGAKERTTPCSTHATTTRTCVYVILLLLLRSHNLIQRAREHDISCSKNLVQCVLTNGKYVGTIVFIVACVLFLLFDLIPHTHQEKEYTH